jgi:hypothetical protein
MILPNCFGHIAHLRCLGEASSAARAFAIESVDGALGMPMAVAASWWL